MSARVQWEGLDELREALRRLPTELTQEATTIVDNAAEEAMSAIIQGYPPSPADTHRRGLSLREGMSTTLVTSAFGVRAQVTNRAKHSWFYDYGTQTRKTALGWNRGAMPATHLFVRTTVLRRNRMYDDLSKMIEAHGLEVSGTP